MPDGVVQGHRSVLAHGVAGSEGAAHPLSRHRDHVHDAALATAAQVVERGADHAERSLCIDLPHLVQRVLGEFFKVFGMGDACVVHEAVDSAVRRHCLRCPALGGTVVGGVVAVQRHGWPLTVTASSTVFGDVGAGSGR